MSMATIMLLSAVLLTEPDQAAVYNDVYEVAQDRDRLCSPLLNDPGPPDTSGPGDLVLSAYSEPGHGEIEVDWPAGTLLYTPDEGFVGFDYLIYTVWEPEAESFQAAYLILSVRELLGDVNYDGFVGQADLDIVLADWGMGELPDALPTVPEPRTSPLVALGLLEICRRRKPKALSLSKGRARHE